MTWGRMNNNSKAPVKSQDPEYLDQKPAKSCFIVATVTSGCVIVLLVLVASIVQFSPNHCCQGPEKGMLLTDTSGLLGKFISLVFGKKGYQEAFPFPSGTGSGSFRNIKITETSKSIAWKQVVCFTCTPFQVNWITCLCRRTYLQK